MNPIPTHLLVRVSFVDERFKSVSLKLLILVDTRFEHILKLRHKDTFASNLHKQLTTVFTGLRIQVNVHKPLLDNCEMDHNANENESELF